MINNTLKTALYVAGAVTLALSATTASFAQFQQNRPRQYQQSENPLGDLIGMIGRASAKSKAKKRWAQVGPEIQQCVNTYLESRKITVQQMIAEGLSPDHEKVTPIVTMCQSVMATQLKENFACNITNSKSVQVATTCVQSYAKAVNGKWAPISRDDFLRAGSNNEQVTIADFETVAAQTARLAEEKRLAQEVAAKAEAARVERLAREEEARRQFAASPEGKRLAAEQAARERLAAAEARRKPRGYEIVCNGSVKSNYNLYVINCKSDQSVSSAFRWAYNTLKSQKWENGGALAESCLKGFMDYKRNFNERLRNGLAYDDFFIQSHFMGCNNGLWHVLGPSLEQAAARKR